MRQIKITPEFEQFLTYRFSSTGYYTVEACAGSGKTTLLKQLTLNFPNHKFLYLAFNKSVIDEANEKFEKNVEVKTIHAFAYSLLPQYLKGKVSTKINLSDYDVDYFDYNPELYRYEDQFKHALIKNLDAYTTQTFSEMSDGCVLSDEELYGVFPEELLYDYSYEIRSIIGLNTSRCYREMIYPNGSIGCSPDAFLKFIADSKGIINHKYDFILIDEAQDSNDVMLKVVDKFSSARVIFVGDPHQQIYGFRGASNAFKKITNPVKKFYLSGTFRFNQTVANFANKILSKKIYDGIVPIRSYTNRESSLIPFHIDDIKDIFEKFRGNETNCVISRTNVSLFKFLFKYWNPETKVIDIDYKFIGGGASKSIGMLWSIHHLKQRQYGDIENRQVKKYSSFEELLNDKNKGHELKVATSLVLQFKNHIYSFLKFIDQKSKEKSFYSKNKLLLCTAHKSKGREFENVFILDDMSFDILNSTDKIEIANSEEEINLLYVAITRTRGHLCVENTGAFETLLR